MKNLTSMDILFGENNLYTIMNAKQILKLVNLKPDRTIFSITTEEALERLLEFIEEWELSIQVKKISKEDWQALFSSYADSIIDYHPEDDHQERGLFLRNAEMLKKYGLTNDDITRLDFC